MSSSLPRKFKIAFEGCARDHIKLTINDIGWRARDPATAGAGFRVYIGGGTATMTTAATVLFDFLPVDEMLNVAEAVIRVFHARGDYQHKQRNRMKFLIKTIGWEAWRAAFDEALAAVRAEGGRALQFDAEPPAMESAPDWDRPSPPAIEAIAAQVDERDAQGSRHPSRPPHGIDLDEAAAEQWRRSNVRAAEATGLRDGDRHRAARRSERRAVPRDRRSRRRLQRRHGARHGGAEPGVPMGSPMTTCRPLFGCLQAAGLALPDADTIADVTSCPGAESCKLAVTQSRGLGQALEQHLRATPELIAMARELDIKISGCPNGCGQHHIATIGFQGSLRKSKASAVPQYFIQVGGGIDAERTTFGRLAAKVPARRAPIALERLVRLYAASERRAKRRWRFSGASSRAAVKALLADLETLTAESATPTTTSIWRRRRLSGRRRPKASARHSRQLLAGDLKLLDRRLESRCGASHACATRRRRAAAAPVRTARPLRPWAPSRGPAAATRSSQGPAATSASCVCVLRGGVRDLRLVAFLAQRVQQEVVADRS